MCSIVQVGALRIVCIEKKKKRERTKNSLRIDRPQKMCGLWVIFFTEFQVSCFFYTMKLTRLQKMSENQKSD